VHSLVGSLARKRGAQSGRATAVDLHVQRTVRGLPFSRKSSQWSDQRLHWTTPAIRRVVALAVVFHPETAEMRVARAGQAVGLNPTVGVQHQSRGVASVRALGAQEVDRCQHLPQRQFCRYPSQHQCRLRCPRQHQRRRRRHRHRQCQQQRRLHFRRRRQAMERFQAR